MTTILTRNKALVDPSGKIIRPKFPKPAIHPTIRQVNGIRRDVNELPPQAQTYIAQQAARFREILNPESDHPVFTLVLQSQLTTIAFALVGAEIAATDAVKESETPTPDSQ